MFFFAVSANMLKVTFASCKFLLKAAQQQGEIFFIFSHRITVYKIKRQNEFDRYSKGLYVNQNNLRYI